MRNLLVALAAVIIAFIIFGSSLFAVVYDRDFYDEKFEQYGVYSRFTMQEAQRGAQNILGFFQSEQPLDTSFVNEREISHLEDVKNLLITFRFVYYSSIALFWAIMAAIYVLDKKHLVRFFSKSLFLSGTLTVGSVVIMALLYATIGFDWLFLKFHEVFFVGNYAFNPAVSNLKALFPDAFFQDMALAVVSRTTIKGIMVGAAGYFLPRLIK